jgi:LuxR family maltose regulon positive regulatory protein
VLRLYPTRLTHREIARELYISLNTVKTHANSIHRKLGVSSRGEAVDAVRQADSIQ